MLFTTEYLARQDRVQLPLLYATGYFGIFKAEVTSMRIGQRMAWRICGECGCTGHDSRARFCKGCDSTLTSGVE